MQALLESWSRLSPSHGVIFGPSEVFEFQVPRAMRRFLSPPEPESIPWILDAYVGLDVGARLLILLKIASVYVLAGALLGVVIGLVLLLVRLLRPNAERWTRTWPFSAASLLCLLTFLNAITALSRSGVIDPSEPAGIVVVLGLIAGLSVLWFCAYNLLDNLQTTSEQRWLFPAGALFVGAAVAVVLTSIILQRQVQPATSSPAGFLSSETPTGANRPNVVLISIDSLRADHLGSYGYSRDTSPNIDRLADEGVLFTQAMSTTSWTLPAHVSMLTGLYPQAHNVLRARERLTGSTPTLAEAMSELGYRTAAFVSAPFLNASYGMVRGFDEYDDHSVDYESHAESHTGTTSPRIHAALEQWLRGHGQDPFFVFAHYWDVHYDYAPPPPYDRMFDPDYEGDLTSQGFEDNPRISPEMEPRDLAHLEALYDGEIAYTDSYIGKLLDLLAELNVDDRTMVVLTSDHGDEFFEHGGKGHFRTLYDEVLRVPLILRFPDRRFASNRIDDVVSLVDILPTILDVAGVDTASPVQGRSLIPLIEGAPAPTSTTYASLKAGRATVRSNNHKFIYNFNSGVSQLFDLDQDPGEQNDLIEAGVGIRSPETRRAIDTLVDWLNIQRRYRLSLPSAPSEPNRAIDEDLARELRALGYID